MNREQSALARRVRQGSTAPPPLTPLLHRVAAKQFRITQNFDKTILNFVKFKENSTKHEIKNLTKIKQNYENGHFCSHPTPTQSAVCYTPSPHVC